MNIGRINGMNYFYNKGKVHQTALSEIARCMQKHTVQKNRDIVTIHTGLNNMQNSEDILIYGAGGKMTKVMERLDATKSGEEEAATLLTEAEGSNGIIRIDKRWLWADDEKENYTERDALMYQYMKQYRLDVQLIENEDGSISVVCNGNTCIMLEEMVSDEELENFRAELSQNGLSEEIDWRGVREDFSHEKIDSHNVDRLELKVNYLCSRYAVLKERIQRQYAGGEQAEQMRILDDIYQKAKTEMADSYAEEIGGFYEYYGQEGVVESFKDSLLDVITERTSAYDAYLTEHSDYATASPGNKWLLQDDRYLAAQLRISWSVSENESQDGFSMEDLVFAGTYMCSLKYRSIDSERKLMGSGWDPIFEKDDSAFGKLFAKKYVNLQEIINNADISSKMKNLANSVIEPDMNALIDLYNVLWEEKCRMCPGLDSVARTKPIDHNLVYQSYKETLELLGVQ